VTSPRQARGATRPLAVVDHPAAQVRTGR